MTGYVNVDRLRAELEFVTANPHLWDQGEWVRLDRARLEAEPGADWTCGTTACLAGWTALHADHRPHPAYDSMVTSPTGVLVAVEDVAQRVLGLSADQAGYLFTASNTLRDLWEFARVFTGGAVQVPAAVAAGPLGVFDPHQEDDYRDLGDGYANENE